MMTTTEKHYYACIKSFTVHTNMILRWAITSSATHLEH